MRGGQNPIDLVGFPTEPIPTFTSNQTNSDRFCQDSIRRHAELAVVLSDPEVEAMEIGAISDALTPYVGAHRAYVGAHRAPHRGPTYASRERRHLRHPDVPIFRLLAIGLDCVIDCSRKVLVIAGFFTVFLYHAVDEAVCGSYDGRRSCSV
jgi:hypothetical protein